MTEAGRRDDDDVQTGSRRRRRHDIARQRLDQAVSKVNFVDIPCRSSDSMSFVLFQTKRVTLNNSSDYTVNGLTDY